MGLLLLAPAAGALTIDDFGSGTVNLITPGTNPSFLVPQAGGTILGGDREEEIDNQSLINFITAGSNGVSWAYGQLNAPGTAFLVWDGVGGGTGSVEHNLGGVGLGVDITEGGLRDAISISVLSVDAVADLTVTVYTGAGNFSTGVITTTGVPGTLSVEFPDFTIGGGTGADFTDVTALTLFIDGSSEPDLDVTMAFIETTTTPEPGSAALLGLGLVLLKVRARRRS